MPKRLRRSRSPVRKRAKCMVPPDPCPVTGRKKLLSESRANKAERSGSPSNGRYAATVQARAYRDWRRSKQRPSANGAYCQFRYGQEFLPIWRRCRMSIAAASIWAGTVQAARWRYWSVRWRAARILICLKQSSVLALLKRRCFCKRLLLLAMSSAK